MVKLVEMLMNASQTMVVVPVMHSVSTAMDLSSVSVMLASQVMDSTAKTQMSALKTLHYVKMGSASTILDHSNVTVKWVSCIQINIQSSPVWILMNAICSAICVYTDNVRISMACSVAYVMKAITQMKLEETAQILMSVTTQIYVSLVPALINKVPMFVNVHQIMN